MGQLRRYSIVLHRWLGLVAGVLLVPIGLSGSMLVFRPELNRLLEPALHVVTPTAHRLPADTLLAAAESTGRRAVRLTFSERADAPVAATLEDGATAYVNPYTGTLLGVRGSREELTGWLFDFHHYLLAGEVGKQVTGVMGLILLVLGMTGVVLWWRGWRRLRRGLTVARGPWRRTNYDLHNAVGAWSLPLLMLAALTGSALVFGTAAEAALYGLSGTPRPDPPPTVTALPGSERAPLSVQLEAAQAVFPAAVVRRADLPGAVDAPLWVRLRQPGEMHPNGMTMVLVDPYTATVLREGDALSAPLAARLLHLRYPLHIGRYGGWFTRILAALVGLMPLLLFITGLLIWWKPRRKRRAVPQASRRITLPPGGIRNERAPSRKMLERP